MRINSIVSKFSNIPLLLQVNEFVNRTQNKYTRFIRMSNISSLYMLPFTSDHFPRNSGHVWEVFGWDLGVGKDPKSPDSWSVQYPLVFAEFWLFASSQLPFKQGAALLTAAAASHKSVVHTSHVRCQSLARWVYRWSDFKLKRIENTKKYRIRHMYVFVCVCAANGNWNHATPHGTFTWSRADEPSKHWEVSPKAASTVALVEPMKMEASPRQKE